jgi:hypothetical protein
MLQPAYKFPVGHPISGMENLPSAGVGNAVFILPLGIKNVTVALDALKARPLLTFATSQ